MGKSHSKVKPGSQWKKDRKRGRSGQYENGSSTPGTRGEEYDDPQLFLLKRTIENNPEMFILNNLMMCVQFFGNYEEEIKLVKETLVSARESELNKNLPPQKHVLLPDVLQEHIARYVGFTCTRQTFRPTIEPLQPVRIYVVHDNVDIMQEAYSSVYSNVNESFTYSILLKPTPHPGYVQLQLFDQFQALKEIPKEDELDLSSIAEADDELYSDADSVYGPKPRSDLSVSSTSRIRSEQSAAKNSKFQQTRSLPNLYDEEERASEHRETLSRSNRSVKAESDYDNGSSSEERRRRLNKKARSKEELYDIDTNRRWEKQVPRPKVQGSTNQDHTSSNSSGYRSDNYAMDSDSSCYNASQNSRGSEHSMCEKLDDSWITNGRFPIRCFKMVTYTADGKVYDPREDRLHMLNSKQRRIKLALRRHNYNLFYVSSTEFMKHFKHMFTNGLANALGFDKECVEDVKREGCVLYCDKIMVSKAFKHSRVEQYEIMPAVWLEWANSAQEWLDRPRSTWPKYMDVEKIKDFGCYVVPEGFVPKGGHSNLMEDLEWQLTFPAAERYLETCMTQAQVQVYLIALMLHKTFMRPIFDTMFSLTASHIRHKLFWMIEEDDRPSKWPDNAMGECLLKLLNSLYYNISRNEPTFKDYFIKGRNLFQRVPCEHLLHTQKQLKRIIENPVMYVFHAMENIRYSDNFFPRLNFEMLLKILTADTLMLINPTLGQNIPRPIPRPHNERPPQDEKYDTTGFWDTVKNQRSKHSLPVTNKTLISPRKATDSIIEISTRCAELDEPRLCALLDFFIRHFTNIAERCNQYKAHQQKTVYLDHADRLAILLFEYPVFKDDARAYRDKIKVLRKTTVPLKSRDEPPETPKRNPEHPIYVAPLNDRFVREPPHKVPPSTVENAQQPQDRSNQTVDLTKNIIKAIVHEAHYEEPDEQTVHLPNSETTFTTSIASRSSTSESQPPESSDDKDEETVTFLDTPTPLPGESTYI